MQVSGFRPSRWALMAILVAAFTMALAPASFAGDDDDDGGSAPSGGVQTGAGGTALDPVSASGGSSATWVAGGLIAMAAAFAGAFGLRRWALDR